MLKPSNLGKEPCDAFAASVPTSSVAAYMIFFVENTLSTAGKGRQMQFFRRYLFQVVQSKFLRREK